SVKDGEIVVLGGLMRDTRTLNTNKVPLLGDIPILGHLFRSTSISTAKTELMIFLVPHIVEGYAQNRAIVQEQAKGIIKAIPDLGKQRPLLNPNDENAKPQTATAAQNKTAKPAKKDNKDKTALKKKDETDNPAAPIEPQKGK